MNSEASIWLHIAVRTAVEIGLVVLIIAILEHRFAKAAWRRNLWQAGLVTALLVLICELSGISRGIIEGIAPRLVAGEPPSAKSEPTPVSSVASVAAGESHETGPRLSLQFRAEVQARMAELQRVERERNEPALAPQSSVSSQSGLPSAVQERATHKEPVLWVAALWSAGSILVFARRVVAWLLFHVCSLRRRKLAVPELLASIDALARSLGISRHVRVIVLPRLHCPIAYGIFRPTVGVPESFLDRMEAARREAILAHELAHIAAHDPFWRWFSNVVTAALWWHPGIWWLRRQLWLASEMAADEASLLVSDGPRNLAESLVEIGQQLVRPRLVGQLEMAGFRSQLGNRVQHLLRLEGKFSGPQKAASAFVKVFGPIALAAVIILCTAWAAPQALTTGETMKTIQLNWKRSLTAMAVFSSMHMPDAALSAARPTPFSPGTPPTPVAGAPGGTPGPAPGVPDVPAAPGGPANPGVPGTTGGGGYGVSGQMPFAAAPPNVPTDPYAFRHRRTLSPGEENENEARRRIFGKLAGITLPEVMFEGLPLNEVLKYLSDQARKLDPAKEGVNFLINPNQPVALAGGPNEIDPATGLPLPAGAVEQVDLSTVAVKFNLPLRNVRLIDAIEAVVKVADRPLQYSVEDYGIVFSLKPMMGGAAPAPRPAPFQGPFGNFIVAHTYRVDTNTFAAGLESAFGIKIDQGDKDKPRSRRIQAALKELLGQLGISMEGNKAIFYNELTGVLMVRASEEDQLVIQAAIETLGGGRQDGMQPGAMLPGVGGVPR
jgi:beta-lactamase regulating signal transducer with metallopeptidase domain